MTEEWRVNSLDLIYKEDLLKGIEDAQKVIDKIPNGIVAEAAKTTINTIQKLVDGLPAVQTCEDAVSRQAAIDAVRNFDDCENGYSDTYDKAFIISALEELPSVQPQITHCAECRHWKHSDVRKNYCEVFDWMNTAGDFCSFAERKDTE